MTAHNIGPYVMIPSESHEKYSAFHVDKIQSVFAVDEMTPEDVKEIGYVVSSRVMLKDCGEDEGGEIFCLDSVDKIANIVSAMRDALNSQVNAFTHEGAEVRGYR